MTFHTIIPSYAIWRIPWCEHSDDMPFCQYQDCMCRFDPKHVERHMVQPIEQGKLTIGEALDRYYCRQEVSI